MDDSGSKAIKATEDEASLLASAGGTLHESSAYETQVLRDATTSHAPKLSGVGFPDLASLAPSYNEGASSRSDISPRNTSRMNDDSPHILQVLSNVRLSLDAIEMSNASNASETRSAQILRIKQHMLLTYLATHTTMTKKDVGINIAKEVRAEAKRKDYLVRKGNAHSARRPSTITTEYNHDRNNSKSKATFGRPSRSALQRLEQIKRGDLDLDKEEEVNVLSSSATASFGRQAVDARNASIENAQRKGTRKKMSMMGLKRKIVEDEGGEWADPEELWNRRLARLERRRLRRGIGKEDPKDGESKQHDNVEVIDLVDSEPVSSSKGSCKFAVSTRNTSPSVGGTKSKAHVDCVDGADSSLSKHMHEGQSIKPHGNRRSRRTVSKPVTYNDDEDIEEYKKMSNRQRRKTLKGWVDDEDVGAVKSSDDELIVEGNAVKRELDDLNEHENIPYTRKKTIDDFNVEDYEDRIDDWLANGIGDMKKMTEQHESDERPGAVTFCGGLAIPKWINDRLFGYQRTALRWLWELHLQDAGGIVGDEMGLGKTVQVCSYLGAMASSRKIRSILIIAPATILVHWLNELAKWAPGLRRVLIHQSAERAGEASRKITKRLLVNLDKWLGQLRADRVNEPIDEKDLAENDPDSFCGTGYVVLTTFESIRRSTDIWVSHKWSYVVMDEGQKIRNPDAEVTIACKRLRTPHRLLLSGTPIQNDLRELWSLFDFVFPGRLGTLPVFLSEFADPIKRGGYSNASPMQVQLAYRCALVLRDLINPYLLRRQKKDIKEVSRMPGKTEQVLFCKLSSRQRTMYEAYLRSDEVRNIIRGSGQCFRPIIMLRKICNHPDLICRPDQGEYESFLNNGFVNENDIDDISSDEEDPHTENYEESTLIDRSGKLEILAKILPLWKKQGHRVLIFSQWKKMLDIIQHFMNSQGWKFGRLDGNTNVAARQKLVDTFNNDNTYFGMLLTTKTGGVGLNLTGANRIILYDPDWNPQSDAQARERAWRFGQKNSVTVYRLITAGTIEEKIYQRQIFKTALSNQVLQDPKQRRMFSQKDLRDLFTLKADVDSVAKGGEGITETGELTKGRGVVDVDADIEGKEAEDNSETLEMVLKSKGLAGVFDHDIVDKPYAKKSLSVREMEHEASKVASRAARSLAQSSATTDSFTPTWTGSKAIEPQRFGGVSRIVQESNGLGRTMGNERQGFDTTFGGAHSAGIGAKDGAVSSNSLLSQVQLRRKEIATGGDTTEKTNPDDETQAVLLMTRIRKYIKRFTSKSNQGPSTSQILEEFSDFKDSDAVLFKSILRQVAMVSAGKWQLR